MSVVEFDLAGLFEHPRLSVRHLIAPAIFRLSPTRKRWTAGERDVAVTFRAGPEADAELVTVKFRWALRELEPAARYNELREELRKLANTQNENQITEGAALGVAFGLLSVLMPDEKVRKVVQIGGRGDFYLNQRLDHMIEISGVKEGTLTKRFAEKKKQILLNASLTKAFVCVVGFALPTARLEWVL